MCSRMMCGRGFWVRLCAVLVALVLSASAAVAQVGGLNVADKQLRVPDNEEILKRTIDSESPYWLPRLLGRYLNGDETLTDEEYHYLYYGYAYAEEYKPLDPIEAEAKLLGAMEKVMESPTEENVNQAVEYGLMVMERDPFSPKNLNMLAYLYGMLGEEDKERSYFMRLNKVLDTIERSGTGVKESSPMHVLAFTHASDLMYARGCEIKRREVVSRTTEFIFLPVKDAAGNLGYYFDFSRVYWTKPTVEEQKNEKRGWTLNTIPLK